MSTSVQGSHVVRAGKHDATVRGTFDLGSCVAPDGQTLGIDHASLLRDGMPWLPVMGEIHFARTPRERWRESLLKMRAGGIDVLASYVFWIHHEEIEGEFDFEGDRDLRAFAQVCADIGMPFVVRVGPWCHGEVRNGGLPNWVLAKPFTPRSTDAGFLDCTRRLFKQIAQQLDGLLWKQGGPVIGMQVDNEFAGPGEYLLALKDLARQVGIDVPYYTRTGWPSTTTPIPFGQLLPLFGVYAEGFWSRELTSMPGHFWRAFTFEKLRTDVEVGMDQLGVREAKDDPDAAQYPYLTCELGGGMEQSYHRRLMIDARDTLAVAICKIGSGSNLPGYYMYHGGTNPTGRRTTLHESQATHYWNDVPVKSYDFQAPLGQFGQVNPSYHVLRRLHLFLREWGVDLARMPAVFPTQRVDRSDDTATLRWSVRSEGTRGFVFINNHQRGTHLSAKHDVRFRVDRPDRSSVSFPDTPIIVPADAICIWPFEMPIGDATLRYATAQPICQATLDDGTLNCFFAQTPGVPSEFVFAHGPRHVMDSPGEWDVAHPTGQRTRIVLLSDEDALHLWKIQFRGRDRVVMCDANLFADGSALHLYHPTLDRATLRWWPADASLPTSVALQRLALEKPVAVPVVGTSVPRKVALGEHGVAEAPTDDDFDHAATWSIEIPASVPISHDVILRIMYTGDVARVYQGADLLTDHFQHGRPFDVSMGLLAPGVRQLTLKVLCTSADPPILYPPGHAPTAGEVSIQAIAWICAGRGQVT
jgi:beta-galactosidase